MATTQDIMAMLRQMRDTRAETGRVGMDAMKYQGDKYNRIGDSLKSMFGSWVAQREAGAERGLKKDLAAQGAEQAGLDRAAQMEMEKDRLQTQDYWKRLEDLKAGERERAEAERFRIGQENETERSRNALATQMEIEKKRAEREAAGGGEKEKLGYTAYLETLTDLGKEHIRNGLTRDGQFDMEKAKANPQKYLSAYEKMLTSYVKRGWLVEEEKQDYLNTFREELAGTGGVGGPVPTDKTKEEKAANFDAQYQAWITRGKPDIGTRGAQGFSAEQINEFIMRFMRQNQ